MTEIEVQMLSLPVSVLTHKTTQYSCGYHKEVLSLVIPSEMCSGDVPCSAPADIPPEPAVFSQMWTSVPWGWMTATQMLFARTPRSCTSACAKWVTPAKGGNVKVKGAEHSALSVPAWSISEKIEPLKIMKDDFKIKIHKSHGFVS